jgi:nitroreductase
MDLFEAVQQRRSVKHYDPSHRMSEAEIHKLLEQTLLSPTSFNIQNWRFVVVQDPDLQKQLRAAAWDQAQVSEASIVIILCADLKAWQKNPERYWRNAPEETQQMIVPMIQSFYDGKEQLQRDEAMRSCGIAGQTIIPHSALQFEVSMITHKILDWHEKNTSNIISTFKTISVGLGIKG